MLKRANMLEFNNFRLVNVIELVSKSQKSHKSQRSQGFKFIVDVHVDVHWSGSLLLFTSWFDVPIDPKVSRYHLLQHPRSGWFEGHHGRM